jgi:hypothetical protein
MSRANYDVLAILISASPAAIVNRPETGSFSFQTVPLDEHEFTNQTACEIYMHSYTQEVIDAFQLVCSRRSGAVSAGQG